jgi:hypothetical protein
MKLVAASVGQCKNYREPGYIPDGVMQRNQLHAVAYSAFNNYVTFILPGKKQNKVLIPLGLVEIRSDTCFSLY